MRLSSILGTFFAALLISLPVWAEETPVNSYESAETFMGSMKFQQGRVELPGGIATMDVPDAFQYIGPADGKRFLEQGWGNPDGSHQIGMLLPVGVDPFGEAAWAVVIRYQEDGYVSDKDAADIDFEEMLETMQATTADKNQEREAQGYPPVTLIGWAATPHYDSEAKKLYWAKELRFGQDQHHTLNYNVRILGRKGVLVMNAISGITQLSMIQERMEHVISFATFSPGYRYSDYDPGVDKVAAYGVAALIGGKAAAKAGLIAKLGGLLVAFKKYIVIGFFALVGVMTKIFKGRRSQPAA